MKQRPFVALWTLAVIATVLAFVLHLGLRGRTVDIGYKLGKARKEQARLREVKRVLSLEAASYRTPQRVEMVARTLFAMTPPPPERVVVLKGPPAPPRGTPKDAPDSPAPPAATAPTGPTGPTGPAAPTGPTGPTTASAAAAVSAAPAAPAPPAAPRAAP